MATDDVITVAFYFSLLSALGASFIIINWLLVRSSRIFFLKLIVYLSIANLLSSASYIMAYIDAQVATRADDCTDGASGPDGARVEACPPDAACLVQAMLMVVFENASVLWTIAIAFTLHEQVVAKRPHVERLEPLFHLGCWGTPLAIATALLLADRLGPADASPTSWCWIRGVALARHMTPEGATVGPEGDGAVRAAHWVQLGAFYLPLLLAFIFNLCTYVRVSAAFRQLHEDGAVEQSKERLVQLRLRLHLGVFVLVWAAPLVHRTLQLWSVDPPELRLFHAATQCSLGSLNCLVYGCNDKTLRPYKEALTHFRLSLRGSRSGVALGATGSATATLLTAESDSTLLRSPDSTMFSPRASTMLGEEPALLTPPLYAQPLRESHAAHVPALPEESVGGDSPA